jgi:hypothetical protein
MKRLRLAVKFGTQKRAEGLNQIVRNNICGVTGSRSNRKEKSWSEEEQEDLRNKRTLKISGLLLVRFWRSQEVRVSWDKF